MLIAGQTTRLPTERKSLSSRDPVLCKVVLSESQPGVHGSVGLYWEDQSEWSDNPRVWVDSANPEPALCRQSPSTQWLGKYRAQVDSAVTEPGRWPNNHGGGGRRLYKLVYGTPKKRRGGRERNTIFHFAAAGGVPRVRGTPYTSSCLACFHFSNNSKEQKCCTHFSSPV